MTRLTLDDKCDSDEETNEDREKKLAISTSARVIANSIEARY